MHTGEIIKAIAKATAKINFDLSTDWLAGKKHAKKTLTSQQVS